MQSRLFQRCAHYFPSEGHVAAARLHSDLATVWITLVRKCKGSSMVQGVACPTGFTLFVAALHHLTCSLHDCMQGRSDEAGAGRRD